MQGDLVVYSGGLDSTVLLAKVHAENSKSTVAVHFRYGQRHDDMELSAAMKICRALMVPYQIIEIPLPAWGFRSALLGTQGTIPRGEYDKESLKQTIVPFRNGIMLSIAAGIAANLPGGCTIHIGAHAGDHAIYPDCRPDFLRAMGVAIRRGTDGEVTLSTPFSHLSKSDIVTLGAKIQAPMDMSYSCYNGGEVHCGECATCRERREAFINSGVPDLTEYEK